METVTNVEKLKNEPKSIRLPNSVEMFGNLKNAKRFAIDIGGSLTKIAYFSTVSHRKVYYDNNIMKQDLGKTKNSNTSINPPSQTNRTKTEKLDGDQTKRYCSSKQDLDDKNQVQMSSSNGKIYEVSESARLHFIKFETKYIESCLDFIQSHLVAKKELMEGKSIKATGGGAYKYSELIQEKLGLMVDKEDELSCLIKGTNFLLQNISDEAFVFQRHSNPEYVFQNADPNIFPYLLVNIGSGVSIMKVLGEDLYERIGGTATGGGTFWGLGSLLTSAKGFDELLELAERGDHRKVDMLVRDIYGGDYAVLGLPGDLIASSFGKATNIHQRSGNQSKPADGSGGVNQFDEADLARSLLFTISNDVGQVACLYAMMHNLNKVYFGGYFLRNHPLSMHTVSYSINYWSGGKVQALFLRHEGYLGAIGAFLKGTEECDTHKYSWLENYAGSSGLDSSISAEVTDGQVIMKIGQLEMDRWSSKVSFCPFLNNPEVYCPDTVDLTEDNEAREYWLNCFEESVDKFMNRAQESQPGSPSAKQRATRFKEKFVRRLRYLREQPFAYGHLTVRSLLDTIEHFLKELDFPDPYFKQKQKENEEALGLLEQHLVKIDELEWEERQKYLIVSMLAGNMFDWGAKEVAAMLENKNECFGFEEAIANIPDRPWLVDSLDAWIARLKGQVHKCAAIFVDNSGLDIVIGVLPFVRELLRRGTQVIICSNSDPALNDVTHTEMLVILERAAEICPIIKSAMSDDNLIAMESGQTGPCLDLSRVSESLCEEMRSRHLELIVLEGMGRSIHTNLNVKFTCECLKVAVIKNRWLAKRLGGDMYSVVCQYQTPNS